MQSFQNYIDRLGLVMAELKCDQEPSTLDVASVLIKRLSGKFPEDDLKAGRELELRNMLNFDAFELVNELPPEKHASDMVWIDEWRGDRLRSRLCVLSSSICWPRLRVARISDYLLTSVLHLGTLEQMRKFK